MQFVRHDQLKDWGIPFSRTHTKRLEDAGQFPKRIRFTDTRNGSYAYDADELRAYVERRKTAR
jgi:hypothetical protein